MSPQIQAAVMMLGMLLDAFGGLLLAYDLLGGKHGPLRLLVRITFYTMLYGVIAGAILGLKFGMLCGIGLGIIMGFDMGHKAHTQAKFSFKYEAVLGLARMAAIGLSTSLTYSWRLGTMLSCLGSLCYLASLAKGRIAPLEYQQSSKLTINKRNLAAAVIRGLGMWLVGFLSVAMLNEFRQFHGLGLRLGLTIGLALAAVSILAPLIEWWTDQLPERALGSAGAVMFVFGFWIQAAPYLVVLLNPR